MSLPCTLSLGQAGLSGHPLHPSVMQHHSRMGWSPFVQKAKSADEAEPLESLLEKKAKLVSPSSMVIFAPFRGMLQNKVVNSGLGGVWAVIHKPYPPL